MIPFGFSLILLDHQGIELLSGQLYFSLNFVPLRSPVSGEAHSHMGTLQLVVLVVLVSEPCQVYGLLPFFGQVRLSHFVGPGLMPTIYLLSEFLSVPSFLPSTLMTLGFPSLTVQSKHRFLRPFF